MTREQLDGLTRFYIDQLPVDWLASATSAFDLGDALAMSYNEYAIATECFEVAYTLAATAETSSYRYDSFGTGATPPKTGARIFKLVDVYYNDKKLQQTDRAALDRMNPNWRVQSSGTPLFWLQVSERKFRLYPTPSGTSDIDIVGYEIPDPALFDTGTEAPDIHEGDHKLIAMGAAMLPILRDPSRENIIRGTQLYQQLQEGYAKARRRIHGASLSPLVIGGAGDRSEVYQPLQERMTPAYP